MFDFSRYKYISLGASTFIIILLFIITVFFHKGFAHSLDFDGGFRAIVHSHKKGKEDLEKFFKQEGIDAVVILIDKEKAHYQIDIGLDAKPKMVSFNERNKKHKQETQPDIQEFITMLETGLGLTKKEVLSAEQVGAIVGNELTSAGTNLIIATIVIMTIYLSFRFQFKFALGASLALFHDLLFTIAFIGAFQIKPSVPLIAAILTLLGYSINDTIVIFDRIRENLANSKLKISFSHIINLSINQTLTRTVNTSFATLIAVIAIVVGGAKELYDFAIVIIFGVVIGTYSSIFIAAPIVEIYEKFFPEKT
ncbi:MAG: protein translocase subunit SecF [Leptospiraceae bacterium]|nr:protein translocase subunit SecF [Leptospiraceae bacterium]